MAEPDAALLRTIARGLIALGVAIIVATTLGWVLADHGHDLSGIGKLLALIVGGLLAMTGLTLHVRTTSKGTNDDNASAG